MPEVFIRVDGIFLCKLSSFFISPVSIRVLRAVVEALMRGFLLMCTNLLPTYVIPIFLAAVLCISSWT
ncbi:hypothetical protein B0J11DRAFT_524358, partial [Dendryphion nanum]